MGSQYGTQKRTKNRLRIALKNNLLTNASWKPLKPSSTPSWSLQDPPRKRLSASRTPPGQIFAAFKRLQHKVSAMPKPQGAAVVSPLGLCDPPPPSSGRVEWRAGLISASSGPKSSLPGAHRSVASSRPLGGIFVFFSSSFAALFSDPS